MLRDDLVRALQVQPHNTDVRLRVGWIDIDVIRARHDDEREAIVLGIRADDLESVLRMTATRPWWRDSL